jgi:metallophosphoesterase (TIGR00282 family)
MMKILFVGDVVGRLGRRTMQALLPTLKQETEADLVVANGENAAGGRGLTLTTADELFAAGVDVITSGNHIWEIREIYPLLDSESPILRPLNYPPGVPGRGLLIAHGSAFINLQGRTFMGADTDCPFRAADKALEHLQDVPVIIIDIHAEATSEKAALAWYLDGRVSAVIGTHTHVATADAHVLPKGTAFVTDAGMVGPRDSIIGVEVKPVIERFLTQLPNRFSPVERGPAIFNSVLIDVDEASGRAQSIVRVDREISKHGQ